MEQYLAARGVLGTEHLRTDQLDRGRAHQPPVLGPPEGLAAEGKIVAAATPKAYTTGTAEMESAAETSASLGGTGTTTLKSSTLGRHGPGR